MSTLTDILIQAAEEEAAIYAQEEDEVSATEELLTAKTGTVYFEAKRQVKSQYEPDVVGLYVPYEFTTDLNELEQRIDAAFVVAKLVVYTQLGVEFRYDDAGIVREVNHVDNVVAQFPGASVQNWAEEANHREDVRTAPRILKQLTVNGQKVPPPAWFAAEAAKVGDTEFWDERVDEYGAGQSAAGKSKPWFKAKNIKNDKGYNVGIWPPR